MCACVCMCVCVYVCVCDVHLYSICARCGIPQLLAVCLCVYLNVFVSLFVAMGQVACVDVYPCVVAVLACSFYICCGLSVAMLKLMHHVSTKAYNTNCLY